MRKSLFLTIAAIAALTLAGCQKSEPVSGFGDNDAIGFAPYIGREVTKAAVTDLTASNLTSFNVASYLTGSAVTYFDTEQSASKNAAGYWETTETYCWPASAKLDFFAYSGSGSGAVSNTGGVAKVAYTVPNAATEDFIVACAIGQEKPSSSPYAQNLNFNHVLSKVSRLTLAPKTTEAGENEVYKYIVTDVRVAGAKNSADYTFNPASGSNWGTASGEQDYAFEDTSFEFLGDSSHKLEADTDVNDQLIILPQTATFTVTYSVKYSCDGGTTWYKIMTSATKTADIEMEAGKAYAIRLQLPIDGSPVVFSASVTEWGDAEEVEKDVKAPVVFSVGSGKSVKFTEGNLYWDGTAKAFHLESSQTEYPKTWDPEHVGHFYWAQTASVAYAMDYSDPSTQTANDKFFCDGSDADHMLTVDGQSGLYALSKDDWAYLLNIEGAATGARTDANRYAKARVDDVNGIIIFPDGYNGGTAISGVTGIAAVNSTSASFPSDNVADWSAMEDAGCVFLPAAGGRNSSSLFDLGSYGRYWSSTPNQTGNAVHFLFFYSGNVFMDSTGRYSSHPIRLVYSVQ